MRAQDRPTARRQLDKRLNTLRNTSFARPPRGWTKAIREALGMTTAQLARRIGVSQSRTVDIEKAEATGAITLGSLERAAHALECELVYALVPRKPLEDMVVESATAIAMDSITATRHTMALEDQSVSAEDEREQVSQLARRLAEKSGSNLWNDQ
jgi:predicted DNA-binding mobile mystery protein A